MPGRIEVSLPGALAALFTACRRETSVEAATVSEALDALDREWPGLRNRLCAGPRELRRHIRVYVRGEIAGLDTALAPGDELVIITAISGG